MSRVVLRRAALAYITRGWTVTPGACLIGSRFACGRPGCPTVASHPALEQWDEAATCDRARVAAWWRHRPHTVLLATGRAFDVVEVPAHLGLRVLGLIRLHGHVIGGVAHRQVHGPVAVTPTGRWMFFVRPGDPLRPELAGRMDVVRHGRGSWVPAPPSRLVEGQVRWAVAPAQTHWQLPDSYAVQTLLVDALAATPAGTGGNGAGPRDGAGAPGATHRHVPDWLAPRGPQRRGARRPAPTSGTRAHPASPGVPRQTSTRNRAA